MDLKILARHFLKETGTIALLILPAVFCQLLWLNIQTDFGNRISYLIWLVNGPNDLGSEQMRKLIMTIFQALPLVLGLVGIGWWLVLRYYRRKF